MDNQELIKLFVQLTEQTNSFDRYLKLKELKKLYKKSAFYKKTKMPFMAAYKWYVQDTISNRLLTLKQFLDAEYLGNFITDMLDNTSPDAVEDFVNKIVGSLNVNELIKSSQDLGEQIKLLKL